MPPILNNSPLVFLTTTTITSAGKSTNIIQYSGNDLGLWFNLNVDLSLFGHGYTFSANFRVIEVATNAIFNHYWNGQLDGLKPFAPSMYLVMSWAKAAAAGVSKSAYSIFGQGIGDGLYLYRPYFLIHAGESLGELLGFTGKSEFGVAEEHYFLLESSD
jgi:hypothetical protein